MGAGSAGCVVANRLAADSSKTGKLDRKNVFVAIHIQYEMVFYIKLCFSFANRIRAEFEVEFSSSTRIGRSFTCNQTIFVMVTEQ